MCRTTKHFHLLNSACSRQVAEADPSRFQLNCPRERGYRRVPEVDGPALFLQTWHQCGFRGTVLIECFAMAIFLEDIKYPFKDTMEKMSSLPVLPEKLY